MNVLVLCVLGVVFASVVVLGCVCFGFGVFYYVLIWWFTGYLLVI
jgi:hypothetical protein